MMKSGIGFIVGKCIDIVSDSFTGRDGTEVKKLSVLIKPDDESTPLELEVWGELAEKFEADVNILDVLVFQVGMVGREWTNQEGKTYRNNSLRIKEWTELTTSPSTKETVPKTPF